MTIYKYPIKVTGIQNVILPLGANILAVQMQKHVVCLWAMVQEKQNKFQTRCIEIFGTGHPMSQQFNRTYIGTVQQEEGTLVWHVFERITGRADAQPAQEPVPTLHAFV